MAKNYYDILGVNKNATADEIKSAYRKLVKQYHPDLHPNDPEAANRFKEINEANETLSDSQKRAAYDYELENPGRSAGGFSGQGFGGFGNFGDIFSDIFSGFGGGSSTRSYEKEKGEDITVEIELSFLDAAIGCSKKITYSRREKCSSCNGTGAKGGTAYQTCQRCGGSGKVQYTSGNGFFRQVSVRECEECHGTGKKIIDKCDQCNGRGYIQSKTPTTVSIEIPAGADSSSYMKKRGFGHASKYGGESGDLIITFRILPHKIFKRKGYDLYVDLPVSYATCVLGGKVKVPTLDGTTTIDISAGTPTGKKYTVRGKGIRSRMGTGNLYVTINVEIPSGLSRSQRKDLEDFEDSLEIKQSAKMREYSDNMQSLYGEKPYDKK